MEQIALERCSCSEVDAKSGKWEQVWIGYEWFYWIQFWYRYRSIMMQM